MAISDLPGPPDDEPWAKLPEVEAKTQELFLQFREWFDNDFDITFDQVRQIVSAIANDMQLETDLLFLAHTLRKERQDNRDSDRHGG